MYVYKYLLVPIVLLTTCHFAWAGCSDGEFQCGDVDSSTQPNLSLSKSKATLPIGIYHEGKARTANGFGDYRNNSSISIENNADTQDPVPLPTGIAINPKSYYEMNNNIKFPSQFQVWKKNCGKELVTGASC
ncbi:hypothetical protein M9194_04325 [Vibrio sp. S4M6]|uniref:hypothetical protein n=1 Tax=Vibrio sinus TaxID=2946865 RepID=UPI00202A2EE7|nr:hypothetical protein [Vibrio sinus]MCL9780662.1 hypothetical protein [Vibrio sinus]